jgi:hypothetical protein
MADPVTAVETFGAYIKATVAVVASTLAFLLY